MPKFMSIHRAPGLSEQEFMMNAPQVFAGKHARMVHSYANMAKGIIVQIYEAENAEALEKEYERLGFPCEEMHEIQFDITYEQLGRMLQAPTNSSDK